MSGEESVGATNGGAHAAENRAWSAEERDTIERAVAQAPSVHSMQPWSLELTGRAVTVHQRRDRELVRHDPDGRDRRISCGAAVANLVVSLRAIGSLADVRWAVGEQTDVVATVVEVGPHEPTTHDSSLHRAIEQRTSYRRRFARDGLSDPERASLQRATSSPDVDARWLAGAEEALVLARLLDYAARIRRGDSRYQRELAMWTSGSTDGGAGGGIRRDAFGEAGLPAVGLVSSEARLPDEARLASWIQEEAVLVLCTPADDAHAHFRVGEVAERVWLEAVAADLAASVMTQPLQLTEVRSSLVRQLELSGTPHLLMRFGRPAEA
ncbi:nitroreductase family protein [Parasphingorhabdus pacifica]